MINSRPVKNNVKPRKSTKTKTKKASSSAKKDASTKRQSWLGRLFSHIVRMIFSPLVLLFDSFRKKGELDKMWAYAMMLTFTLVLILFVASFFALNGFGESVLESLVDPLSTNDRLNGEVRQVIGYINKYALENDIDPNLIFAIVKSESNFKELAVSKSGARGLMQLMPAVWRQYSNSECSGQHTRKPCCDNCIFAPEANIRTGVKYFKYLLGLYNNRVDLALEAYNAGMANVQLEEGADPKFVETKYYVRRTVEYWQQLRYQMLDARLQCSFRYRNLLKWLLLTVMSLWLVFFWWCTRKMIK